MKLDRDLIAHLATRCEQWMQTEALAVEAGDFEAAAQAADAAERHADLAFSLLLSAA